MIRMSRIWKFYIISTSLFVVLVTVAGFILQGQLKKKLKAQLAEQVFTLSKVLARVLPDTTDPSILVPWCRDYQDAAQVRITVMQNDGTVIGDSDEDSITGDSRLDRPEVREAIAGGFGTVVRYSETLGVDMFYAAMLFKEKGKIIRLAIPMTEVRAIENEVMFFFALVLYFIPFLAIAISFLFARYVASDHSNATTPGSGMLMTDSLHEVTRRNSKSHEGVG
jgi:two-component system, OmpR family, phosphate regulon sensor histidine kinase PhoR